MPIQTTKPKHEITINVRKTYEVNPEEVAERTGKSFAGISHITLPKSWANKQIIAIQKKEVEKK